MRKLILVKLLILLPLITLANVENLFNAQCVACHGADSTMPKAPNLHGQNADYIIKQLNAFKSGERTDTAMGIMGSISNSLSDQQIAELATYFSGFDKCDGPKESALEGDVAAGEAKANTCMGCHQNWMPGIDAPNLTGQKYSYIVHALNSFKEGQRTNPMMSAQASGLSEQDIKNLGAYFTSTCGM